MSTLRKHHAVIYAPLNRYTAPSDKPHWPTWRVQTLNADKLSTIADTISKPSRKTEILCAAADLFAQQGFEGSSISAIASKADVKKALIQYHFDNKLHLWQATVTMAWQQRSNALPRYLDEKVLQQLAENDQQHMVRDLCKLLLQFTFDQPQWVRLMFQEASTPGPRLDWMVENFFKDDFNNGLAMIELAQQRGLLPQVNAMDLLHILSGALIYLVNVAPITAKVTGEDPSSDAYMDRHINTLMAILNSH